MSARSLAAVLVSGALACGPAGGPGERLNEVERVRSGDIDVVLLSPGTSLSPGPSTVTLEFRAAAEGRLVDVGAVKVSATMPMPGMAPMFAGVEVQPTNVAGRYLATTDFGMAGEWRLAVEWNGPPGQGSATFSPPVR